MLSSNARSPNSLLANPSESPSMEISSRTGQDDDDDASFLDAGDEFIFYDCADSFSDESEPSTSYSDIHSPAATLRRRRSRSRSLSGKQSNSPSLVLSTVSESASVVDDKRCEISPNSTQNGEESNSTQRVVSDHKEEEHSTVTTVNEAPVRDSIESASQFDDSSFDVLLFLAGLMIKAIGFQIKLFISFMTFPIWGFCTFYAFVTDPFRTLRRCRECFIGKVESFIELVCGLISPLLHESLKDHKAFLQVALRFGWGLLWAFYVLFVLCSILGSSLVFSGCLMKYLVEEPVQIEEVLNFDFTKLRPVAYVPIISCAAAECGVGCEEQKDAREQAWFRVIPATHRLQAVVSFTVPESEYNRNLGIFQVRVDLLSIKGETLASSSHPCMLHFNSEPIRLLLTFLKVAPLITGYGSESQTIDVKFKGFREGDVPTSCLKVTIEQRAEYRPGAGIPEIYKASLAFQSELPLFQRLLWNWKRTIFVWTAMISFTTVLMCTLLCCRPVLMPRIRPRR